MENNTEQLKPTKEEIINAKSQLNECYYALINILKSYIDTNEQNYKIIALWIIGTYFHSNFNTYPYLFFNAMRGSGKTRTLRLISALAANGDGSVQNNLTEAVLFRIPRGTTTCIDEVEQIGSKEKQTLRELLNSAYKKGMKVKRMRKSFSKEGEKQVVEVFEPYFPICMANIYGVEEVLGDRSIVLVLEKSNNPAMVMKIEDFERNDTILSIKRTLAHISVVSVVSLQEKDYSTNWNKFIDERYQNITTPYTPYTLTTLTTQTTLPINTNVLMRLTNFGVPAYKKIEYEEFFNKLHDLGIYGRNFELFFPLLIISDLIGDEVFTEIGIIASKLISNKKEDELADSKDVSLYEFISSLDVSKDFISVKELTQRFRNFLGESDEEDRWLNDKWFGRALKRLNLTIDKRRMNSGRFVTLNHSKAKEKLKIFKNEGEIK